MKYLTLIFVIMFTLNIKAASATNLRGQIVRYNPGNGTYYALAGIRVDIMIWNGQQWINSAYAITDNNGFYFFLNYAPGATFCISVFGRYYPPQQPLQILNYAPQYYQDIPVIST